MNKPSFFSPDHPAYPTLILLNVIMTTFLCLTSAVATVISNNAIQGELALSDTESIWVTTLYLLGVNTTVPTANWFANRFGFKRMYTYGVLIFTLASAIVGFANHFFILAAARLIEGVGAGLIFPIGLALVVQTIAPARISLAISCYFAGAFGGGLGIGTLLSGYFTQFGSWRSIFFLIVPMGFIEAYSCWLSRRQIPEREQFPFDWGGFFFFATFIASLLVALTLGPIKATTEGWRSWYIIGLFLLAAVSLVITLLIERKHPYPLIPMVLFKDPIFAIGSIAMFLIGMSIFSSVSVSIEYMINALSYEKYVTGKIATVYGVAVGICGFLVGQLTRWVPVPIMTFVGLSLLVYSYFLNNELSWLTGVNQVFWILLLRGIGVGCALGPTTLLALHGVPTHLRNSAATLLTFFRQVGGTYGGTILAIFSIRQTIFHAARFGEQANTQLPGYKMTFQNLMNKYPDPIQAKGAIVQNILTQAYVQGLNDALTAFGYITGTAALLLMVVIAYRYWFKNSLHKNV